MRRWLDVQLGRLLGVGDGVVIALDPEHVLSKADVLEMPKDIDVLRVSDWVHLRRAWDLDLRPLGSHARAPIEVRHRPRAVLIGLPNEASSLRVGELGAKSRFEILPRHLPSRQMNK